MIDHIDMYFFVSGYQDLEKFEHTYVTRKMLEKNFVPIWDFIFTHKMKFKSFPSLITVKELTGLNLDIKSPEPFKFWEEKVFDRFAYSSLHAELIKMSEMIQERKTYEIIERMAKFSKDIMESKSDDHISFKDLYSEEALIEFAARNKEGISTVETPYPSLTKRTGGWRGGELIVIAARPNVGKTYSLLHFLMKPFLMGKKFILVSTEMSEEAMMLRSAALYTKTSYTRLRNFELSDMEFQIILEDLRKISNSGNALLMRNETSMHTTLESIEYALYKHKPDILGIDGAYLLSSPTINAKDRFNHTAEVFNAIKGLARKYDVPIIVTTQINREQGGRKKEKMDMSRLAFSDNIGMVSDWIFYLNKDEDDDKTMIIQPLKQREADNWNDIKVNWDFQKNDFSEQGVVADSGLLNPYNPINSHKPFIVDTDEIPDDLDI